MFATQTLEQLVVDIGNIRTHLNTTELQLYEANEKISELIENVSVQICRACNRFSNGPFTNYAHEIANFEPHTLPKCMKCSDPSTP